MRTLMAAATLAAMIAPAAAEGLPDYAAFEHGTFLPYLNAEPGDMTKVPHLNLSFGDRNICADLDSGSTGIVVAARYIPNFDQLQSTGTGRLTYTSSGRVMRGQWVVAPVTIAGRDGASVTTEPMPVLAVTEVTCLDNARDCTPSSDPDHIAMIGIGFAREGDAQHQSTPDKNPFLHVTGESRRGWILTRDGVHVGLTRENTRGDFRFVKLDKDQSLPDWDAIPACIMLNGATPRACGTMLVDTGVSVMFMTVPPAQANGQTRELAQGTAVSISIGKDGSAGELYHFTVGDGSPLAPTGTHRAVRDDRVFVNTSFHLLNGFDVLYDADGGFAGFRPR